MHIKTRTILFGVIVGVALLLFAIVLTKSEREESLISEQSAVNSLFDTSMWKTYINEEISLEIKYPDQWEVTKGVKIYFGAKAADIEPRGIILAIYHETDVAERALKYAPELKSTQIAGYPALIGEGFDENGDYGLLAYVQRDNDRFEFLRPPQFPQTQKIIFHPELPGESIPVPVPSSDDKKIFESMLSTVKFKAGKVPFDGGVVAYRQARDWARVVDSRVIENLLRTYFVSNNRYPKDLDELTTDIKRFYPEENVDLAAFIYRTTADFSKYHLGVTMESHDEASLKYDKDFNSLQAGWAQGFDGSDLKKCREEDSGEACYDVIS